MLPVPATPDACGSEPIVALPRAPAPAIPVIVPVLTSNVSSPNAPVAFTPVWSNILSKFSTLVPILPLPLAPVNVAPNATAPISPSPATPCS